MNEQELAEVNSQLVQIRAQVTDTKARFDRIQAVINADSVGATVDGTVTDTLNNQVVSKLRSQYLELANREADWSARYGHNHLAVVNLRNQMHEIRISILDELKRMSESYKSDYEIAKQRADDIKKQFAVAISQSQTANQAQVDLRDLESTAQTYRALYDNFLQRYMESIQQQSFPITEARIITEASRPLVKSSPRSGLILALCALGGSIFSFGVARFIDASDRAFRTNQQVDAHLHVRCVSIIPLIRKRNAAQVPPPSSDSDLRSVERHGSLFWEVIDSPFSRFSESIRAIKVDADLECGTKSGKVIGFTSTLPNEGKSTIAAAFAYSLAQSGARTILVDCDLRNPSLSRALTQTCKNGLQDMLTGHCVNYNEIARSDSTGLIFIPAATRARIPHSSGMLGSEAAKSLFQKLREDFDYVVVDLSPLAPVVDVRTTANFVDLFYFVIEWGRTKIDVVEHALGDAPGVYERIGGVILNKADVSILSRYGYYDYYKSKYYSQYGYAD